MSMVNTFIYNLLAKLQIFNPQFYNSPIFLSFLTILFLTISFPPLDQWYMAWVSLVPWLSLIKRADRLGYLQQRVIKSPQSFSSKSRIGGILKFLYIKIGPSSMLIGLGFFLINLAWLRHVTYAAWILLSLYSMGYFVAFGLIAHLITKKAGVPLTFIAPFLWVSLEYVRSFLISGFPWFFLGHSQYSCLTIIQISDITGVYGITFAIVLANAGITELLSTSVPCWRGWRGWMYLINLLLPLALLSIIIIYGLLSLKDHDLKDGPTISVVQGNIPQYVKDDPDEIQQIKNLHKHIELSAHALRGDGEIGLIVWPETMAPGILNINPDISGNIIDRIVQDSIRDLARVANANLLIGGIAIKIDGQRQSFYNSAFYYNKDGVIVDRYDKIHLVPFGEYTPLKRYFPFLSRLVPYEVSLSHGEKLTTFALFEEGTGAFRFGTLICYEDTIPPLVRGFCNKGVDFLINITNDGWFKDSGELDQHLAIMVFRAVENRIGMVRSANTGISAFIDPNGEIYSTLKDSSGAYKEVEGVLIDRVKLLKTKNDTWYTRNGDCFAHICCLTTGIALLIAIFKLTRFKAKG